MNQTVNREKESNHRFRRIYIDSKYRTSGTATTFTITLPETCEMSHNHRFLVDDVCLPRSWYNVGSNNNYVYISWVVSGEFYLRRAMMTPGDYDGNSFASELATALNTLGRGTFSVSFSTRTARLTVSNSTLPFKMETDADLNSIGIRQDYNVSNGIIDAEFNVPQFYNLKKEGHKSINYVSGNFVAADTGTIKVLQPINLNWLDTIYIHASGMGAYNTLNLRAEKTIIKEIKIDGQAFSYVFDNANQWDWLDCSHQTWSSIIFSLRDKNGNEVEMNDRDVSFSLVLEDLTL